MIPWFGSPPDGRSFEAATIITTLWLRDAELGDTVAGLPWLADGVVRGESAIPRFLQEMADADIALAKTAALLPWLADEVSIGETSAFGYLARFARQNLELPWLVIESHWFNAEVTSDTLSALHFLEELSAIDPELARLTASVPWLADDITGNELSALRSLQSIASHGFPELAKLLAGFPWFADGADRDLHDYVLTVISHMTIFTPHAIGQLTAQPWFTDGLDYHEAAFVTALPAYSGTTLYEDLLQAHFMQTITISLPLAGDVNIWVIQNAPFPPDDDLLAVFEDAIRASESFMGAPFPTTDIVVLVVVNDDNKAYYLGSPSKHGTGILLYRYEGGRVPAVPHETAHYYTAGGPSWFREGAAEFIEAYFNDWKGMKAIEKRANGVASNVKQACIDGPNSIEDIWHLLKVYVTRKTGCHYAMGENFLHGVYTTIGEEAMSAAMRELHLRTEEYEGWSISEEQIYDAFLEHAPSDRKEAFRDLYRRLHGGPYAYPDDSFSDDHGDETEDASVIEVGEVVEGALDYRFDFDHFRFHAQEGQKYRMNVNHESLHFASIALYSADGWLTNQNREWISRTRVPSGPQILWVAPSSGEYYFVVENFGGKSGTYTLRITTDGG